MRQHFRDTLLSYIIGTGLLVAGGAMLGPVAYDWALHLAGLATLGLAGLAYFACIAGAALGIREARRK